MGIPALGIAPMADEKTHADSTDTMGRSALMTQLTKSADEMLQVNARRIFCFSASQRSKEAVVKSAVSFASLVEEYFVHLSYCLGFYSFITIAVWKRCETLVFSFRIRVVFFRKFCKLLL